MEPTNKIQKESMLRVGTILRGVYRVETTFRREASAFQTDGLKPSSLVGDTMKDRLRMVTCKETMHISIREW